MKPFSINVASLSDKERKKLQDMQKYTDMYKNCEYTNITCDIEIDGVVYKDVTFNYVRLSDDADKIIGDVNVIPPEKLVEAVERSDAKLVVNRSPSEHPHITDRSSAYDSEKTTTSYLSFSDAFDKMMNESKEENATTLKVTIAVLSIWGGPGVIEGIDGIGKAIAGTGKLGTTLYYSGKIGYKGYLVYNGVKGTIDSAVGAYDAFSEGRYWAGSLEVGKGLLNIVTVKGAAKGIKNDATSLYGKLTGQTSIFSGLSSNLMNNQNSKNPMEVGIAKEKEALLNRNLPKNTEVWRPTEADVNSQLFKDIVGEAKFTKTGLYKGTIFDSTRNGFLEIKAGTSALNSTYQLRLQTYRAVSTKTPYTISTNRTPNPTFLSFLNKWDVNMEKLK
ncbi:hypothetical protein [Fusobacterium sp. PH5-44]